MNSISFTDAEFPEVVMEVDEDLDVSKAFEFRISSNSTAAIFVLSAHDRVRLIELLGGTDANSD